MNELIITERSNLTAIADAVRGKTGTTASMTLGGIVDSIQNIATNPTLQNKTVTPTTSVQTVSADSGYDGLSNVTVNAIPSTYVKPTATKAATTYTPTTANQTIASGTYCSGAQTIKGDSNLIAENIKSGVSIFGVSGTCSSLSTCTVVLDNSEMYTATTMYYTNSSGAYVSGKAKSGKRVSFTVLCGTMVLISGPAAANTIGASIHNGTLMATIYEDAFIRIDASAGETCTIIVSAT